MNLGEGNSLLFIFCTKFKMLVINLLIEMMMGKVVDKRSNSLMNMKFTAKML